MEKDLGLSQMTEVQLRYTLSNELIFSLHIAYSIIFAYFRTIPILLDKKDALVKSQTGSGKTLSYGIPIVEVTF